MKTLVRVLFTFFAVVASFYFILYITFSLIQGVYLKKPIQVFVASVIAACIGIFIWKKTGNISNSLATYILLGGIIVGAVGFISGFIGPIIFYPSSNQGPLLGIFITGPLGFLVGLIGGGVYGLIKKK